METKRKISGMRNSIAEQVKQMCYFDLWFGLPAEHIFVKQNDKLVCCYNFLFCHIKLESNYRKVIYTALISFWHISANKNCQLLANNMKQKDILTIILLLYSFKNMFRYENNTKRKSGVLWNSQYSWWRERNDLFGFEEKNMEFMIFIVVLSQFAINISSYIEIHSKPYLTDI